MVFKVSSKPFSDSMKSCILELDILEMLLFLSKK